MKLPRNFCVLFFTLSGILSVSLQTQAQRLSEAYYEVGVSVGSLNYSGDVATQNNLENLFREMSAQYGMFLQYQISPKFSSRVQAMYGRVYANDANHSNPDRGVTVKTRTYNLTLSGEYSFRILGRYNQSPRGTPFLRAGIGISSLYPNGDLPALNPSVYETFRTSYTDFHMMTGGGYKFKISNFSRLSLVAQLYFLPSDRLEGFRVRTRQTSMDLFGGFLLEYSVWFK